MRGQLIIVATWRLIINAKFVHTTLCSHRALKYKAARSGVEVGLPVASGAPARGPRARRNAVAPMSVTSTCINTVTSGARRRCNRRANASWQGVWLRALADTPVCVTALPGRDRVRMVQKLAAELRGLIGKRAPTGPPPAPPPAQPLYSRKDLKTNLSRHMSIVLDRSVLVVWHSNL